MDRLWWLYWTLTKEEDGFVYQLKVSTIPFITIQIWRNVNMKLEDQRMSALDIPFMWICHGWGKYQIILGRLWSRIREIHYWV